MFKGHLCLCLLDFRWKAFSWPLDLHLQVPTPTDSWQMWMGRRQCCVQVYIITSPNALTSPALCGPYCCPENIITSVPKQHRLCANPQSMLSHSTWKALAGTLEQLPLWPQAHAKSPSHDSTCVVKGQFCFKECHQLYELQNSESQAKQMILKSGKTNDREPWVNAQHGEACIYWSGMRNACK